MTNYVKTTNFLRKDSLPDASTEKIIRGSEFDTEFNNLVIAVASKANLISPNFSGIPTAPTASAGSATTQLATTAFVAQNAILTGMIVMWSGAIASIPIGYALCDGGSGTPDLRDKFVVGAGNTYAVNATGGTADATLVSHNHTTTVTDPGHQHTGLWNSGAALAGGDQGNAQWFNSGSGHPNPVNTSKTNITVTNTASGVSGTNKNLPPYYALAYIMKT